VVVALIAASIAATVPAGTGREALYATVIAAIVLTTLLTAATFLLLGQFRLGALVRYLPYPVLGGFLAGTGWLLVLGGGRLLGQGGAACAGGGRPSRGGCRACSGRQFCGSGFRV